MRTRRQRLPAAPGQTRNPKQSGRGQRKGGGKFQHSAAGEKHQPALTDQGGRLVGQQSRRQVGVHRHEQVRRQRTQADDPRQRRLIWTRQADKEAPGEGMDGRQFLAADASAEAQQYTGIVTGQQQSRGGRGGCLT